MTEGNHNDVTLYKSKVLMDRGLGMTLPNLATKYGLSKEQMKLALIDMGAMKAEESSEEEGKLTVREQKYIDICAEYSIEPSTLTEILDKLGLEYKTGRRSSGGRKFIIVDDITE